MAKAKRTDYGLTANHIKKLGFKFMKATGSRKLDKSIAYDSDEWRAVRMTNGKYFLHDPTPGDPRPYAIELDHKMYRGEMENALLCDLQWLTENQFHKKASHLIPVTTEYEFSVDEIAEAIQLMETLDE